MRIPTAGLVSSATASRQGLSRGLSMTPTNAAKALSMATSQAACPSSNRIERLSVKSNRASASTPLLRRNASTVPTSSLVSVSTLPNGVRIATDATPGHFPALGIYIDAGSRLERPWVSGESGVSHLIDRMAFKSTDGRTTEQMSSDIEKVGGNVMCSSSRETIMYQASAFSQCVPDVLSILSDTVLNPRLTAQELDEQKEAAAYEVSELWNKPEMIIPEILHEVAYNRATLGNSLLCSLDTLPSMTTDNLRSFMRSWFTPDRIVVAGAGVDHQQLLELTEPLFGKLSAPVADDSPSLAGSASASSATRSSSSRSNSISSLLSNVSAAASTSTAATSAQSADFSTAAKANAKHLDATGSMFTRADVAEAKAVYVGGARYDARNDMDFTHVYVAFEGLSIQDEDIYALATLQVLLGGGGSFSAGGPGKGMYSRLYTNVLNQHHAVDYCAAFHHCYADSGLFGIAASVHPSFNRHIPGIIARELELVCSSKVAGAVTEQELQRAKNQLKSSLVMALESRLVQVEDVGRQVQVHGRRVSVEEMCEKIDAVDVRHLTRVAKRVLRPEKGNLNFGLGSGQASVVAMGNLDGLGDIQGLLRNRGLGARW